MSAPVKDKTTTTTSPVQTEQETHKVFVGNLSFTSSDESLKTFFDKAGNVVETIIIKRFGRPKGYGFVGYATLAEAEKATKDLDKSELDGREISVQLAKPREPKEEKEQKPKKAAVKKSRKTAKKVKESTTETTSEASSLPESVPSVKTTKEEKASAKPKVTVETTKEEEVVTKPKTTVFVANLPLTYKVSDLQELFKEYDVESALVAIKPNGRSKGYGFVELKTVDEMQRVLTEFVDIKIEDREIHISAATSEKNTERKVKPKSGTRRRFPRRSNKAKEPKEETEEETTTTTNDDSTITTTTQKKTKKRRPSRKPKVVEQEKEGTEASNEAQEAVNKPKQKDGAKAAVEANTK